MPQIMLECKNCSKIFPSGISMSPGSSATLIGNQTKCPHCQSWENIPDGTFMATVNGFVDILRDSKNPLKDAKEILRGFEKEDLSDIPNRDKIEELLRKNKLKIAAVIIVLRMLVEALTQRPETEIDNVNINQQFHTQYNQYIDSSK